MAQLFAEHALRDFVGLDPTMPLTFFRLPQVIGRRNAVFDEVKARLAERDPEMCSTMKGIQW